MAKSRDVRLPQPIYVISDGTGGTAEQVVRAALRQFKGYIVDVRTFSDANETDRLRMMLRRAKRHGALVVTTLVQQQIRDTAARYARDLGLQHVELMGDLLQDLEDFLSRPADEVPGRLHQADEKYFRRIEAVEFTVKADDGKDARALREADLVLVGVSRTSKTPLSTFLAHKGFKVGNVPIVLEKAPPRELFDISPGRVFALTIDPEALETIRRSRIRAMGVAKYANYADSDYILAELEFAMELYRSNPWPIIDVTNRAIEETAATILTAYHEAGHPVPEGDVSSL